MNAMAYMEEHFDKVIRSKSVKAWPKDLISDTTFLSLMTLSPLNKSIVESFENKT